MRTPPCAVTVLLNVSIFRMSSSPVTLTIVPDGVSLQSVLAEPAPAGLLNPDLFGALARGAREAALADRARRKCAEALAILDDR